MAQYAKLVIHGYAKAVENCAKYSKKEPTRKVCGARLKYASSFRASVRYCLRFPSQPRNKTQRLVVHLFRIKDNSQFWMNSAIENVCSLECARKLRIGGYFYPLLTIDSLTVIPNEPSRQGEQ